MNKARIQNLLESLVETNLPNIENEKKANLLSLYNRILTHDFPEEYESEDHLEMKLVKFAGDKKSRLIELMTNLKNKNSCFNKNNVYKCLLKISENNFRSNNSTRMSNNFSTNKSIFNLNYLSKNKNNNNFLFQSQITNNNKSLKNTFLENFENNKIFKDLISTFQAVQSEHFQYDKKLKMFVLKKKYEKLVMLSMYKFLLRLSEIGWMYMKIQKILSSVEKRVNTLTFQSLVGAINNELNSFYEFLSMLDNYQKGKNFKNNNYFVSLQIFSEDMFDKLKNLAYIIETSYDLTSTEILSFLYVMSKNSFIERKKYLLILFEKSTRAFIEFLNHWISQGEVLDPMNEFFVKINQKCHDEDKKWKNGLKFMKSKLPYFLDSKISKKIYKIGKIIRLLKKIDINFIVDYNETLNLEEIVNHKNNLYLSNKLDSIFKEKSEILLKYLSEKKNLKKIFNDCKGVFLTMRGDLISSFILNMDLEIGLKNIPTTMKHNLMYSFDNAIRNTIRKKNHFIQDLKIFFFKTNNNIDNIDSEDYFENFTNFTFNSKIFTIPVNYFFDNENLKKYQQCFRYLLTFKIEQFQLNKIWQLHSANQNSKNVHISNLTRISSLLRMKMLAFINGILGYWMIDIIEKNWKIFQNNLNNSNDFDSIINSHEDYIIDIFQKLTLEMENEDSILKKKKEKYDYLLHEILKYIKKFKQSQEIIFGTLKDNLNNLNADSFDSVERLEDENLNKYLDLSVDFVRKMNKGIRETERGFSNIVLEFIEFFDTKLIRDKLDFNEYYLNLRRLNAQNQKDSNIIFA